MARDETGKEARNKSQTSLKISYFAKIQFWNHVNILKSKMEMECFKR